jgi:hypothetical protein
LAHVANGLGAMESSDVRAHVDPGIRNAFGDSLDIDSAFEPGHENENRWDYLLGHAPSRTIVALEPHSAKADQISTIIRKKDAASDQLRPHLRDGARVADWFWVASGDVDLPDTDKARRRLDQHGIRFVGKRLLEKHLPAATRPAAQR